MDTKKVGIVTTHGVPNYGAIIQAYAMQKFLVEELGDEVEFINYVPEKSKRVWRIIKKIKQPKDILRNIYIIINFPAAIKRKIRFNKEKEFVKSNLCLTAECKNEDDILKLPKFDAYICGSDQIWNFLQFDEPIYYLYFTKKIENCKKISYAPSITDKIPEKEYEKLRNYLNNLDAISVREEQDIAQIQPLTSKPVVDVCDPVFLIDPEKWKSIAPKRIIDKPYILLYFLGTNQLARDTVKRIKEITGLTVVHLNINDRDRFNADIDLRTADPLEFISLIRDAEYVCTNSHHCTAFSLMFHKRVTVIRKSNSNSRFDNMIKHCGVESLYFSNDQIPFLTLDDLEVDYSHYDESTEIWIKKSKDFLRDNL